MARWNARVADSIFSLVGAVVSTLRRDQLPEEVENFLHEVRCCGLTEEQVLKVAEGYVEVGSSRKRRKEAD